MENMATFQKVGFTKESVYRTLEVNTQKRESTREMWCIYPHNFNVQYFFSFPNMLFFVHFSYCSVPVKTHGLLK